LLHPQEEDHLDDTFVEEQEEEEGKGLDIVVESAAYMPHDDHDEEEHMFTKQD
jgi:hypothetical protein